VEGSTADDALSCGPVRSSTDSGFISEVSSCCCCLSVVDAQIMDGYLCRPAGILGSPPASRSQPADSDMLTSGSSSKPLAFSIDRIMARTPEPKSIPLPTWFQSAPLGKSDVCPSSLHCMIPLVPIGFESGHRLSITGLDPGHLDASSLPAPADFFGFGLNYTNQQEDSTVSQSAGQYKLFRPRVVNQSSLHTMGTVCYLNCSGESGACPPPAGLVNLHPMASYLLSARHKALMSEKSKSGLQQTGERYSVPSVQAFKELSQSHIQHYMKERDQILTDKIFKGSAVAAAAAARLSGTCPSSKPKVFTCEVCGKVSAFQVELFQSQGGFKPDHTRKCTELHIKLSDKRL